MSSRVYVKVELMDDGSWYATLYVKGKALAGSGRHDLPADALAILAPNLEPFHTRPERDA